MLELPEVEVLRKDLEKEVVGKRVKEAEIGIAAIVRPYHRTRPDFKKHLEGRKIEGVRRRGTILLFDLDEDWTWILDPGQTANLHRETMNEPSGPDTDVRVTFTIGGAIHVSDPTKGESCRMGVVPTEEALDAAGIREDALDLLDDAETWLDFGDRLRAAEMPMKQLLMDDDVLLGVGTVYSDEALFEAGIAHDRMSNTLSTQEVRRFYRSIHEVLQAAMKQRDTHLHEPEGDAAFDDEGEPVEHLRVYGRDGQPCLRCRDTIKRTELGDGIVTYHCERCQM